MRKEYVMLFYLTQFVQTLLLPPCSNLLLVIIGFLVWRYKPLAGKIVVFIALLGLWLLSTPFFAQQLIDGLQYQYAALSPSKLKEDKTASIVVLEAGLNLQSPEYGMVPLVSEATLTRLRYSAFLYQKTQARILVSGNDPTHSSINQTDYMANALKEYFGVPTKWREDRGYNTALEGIFSAEILKKAGIKKIYLVTIAYHMPRSIRAFQNKELEVIPAPTAFMSTETPLKSVTALLPSTKALDVSVNALHEYLGLFWYQIYYLKNSGYSKKQGNLGYNRDFREAT